MKSYKKSYIKLASSLIVVLFALLTIGCNDTNFDIGTDYLPNEQVTTTGSLDFQGCIDGSTDLETKVMSTKLYRTNRIASSRQTVGLFGAQRDEIFGERRSRFFAQYLPNYSLDDEGFGYEPVLDSVVIYLSVKDYSGDTTVTHTYNVYEVVDDTFLTASADTLFNVDYEFPSGAFSSTPLFSFDFPDFDNEVYISASYVKARIETTGADFINRLMLKEGEDGSQIDYTYYKSSNYEDFVEVFKGLYICPADMELATATGDTGATYSLDLQSSGFGFFARNRQEDDPAIIADTVGMSFSFYNSSITDIGNVSITTVDHDYSMGAIDVNTLTTNEEENDTHTSTIRVEGMGGVATQITLEPAMFEEFERVIAEASGGDDIFTTIFFNVAKLTLYTESATTYDMPLVMTPDEADSQSELPTRLGLYTVYSTYFEDYESELEAVADYDYVAEIYYSVVSDFSGSYNRSLGCYTMYIAVEMQDMWNDYIEAKEEAGGDASMIDWDAQEWNKLVVGPTASDLFNPRYVSLQGEADGANQTPMRLEINYTLLK